MLIQGENLPIVVLIVRQRKSNAASENPLSKFAVLMRNIHGRWGKMVRAPQADWQFSRAGLNEFKATLLIRKRVSKGRDCYATS